MSHSSVAASGVPSPARAVREFTHTVAAPPAAVFPLLCPVRERDWVDGWDARLVHAASGLAEDHCVFVTPAADGAATWVVTRHDPPAAIGFAIFHPGHVERLDIAVTPTADGSELRWRRTYTALGEPGHARIAELAGPALDARMARLELALRHYCATGTCLRGPAC